MNTYAKNTAVSSDRSLVEIKNTLKRYGASGFAYMEQETRAQVAFKFQGRHVRFSISLPDANSPEFTRTATGRARTATAAQSEYEAATRQRWRALALVVKAKLEAVESQVASFEQEFLPYLVLPGGQTVYEQVGEQVQTMLEAGERRPLQLEG